MGMGVPFGARWVYEVLDFITMLKEGWVQDPNYPYNLVTKVPVAQPC